MFDVQGDRNSVKKAKSLKEHTIKTRFDDGKVSRRDSNRQFDDHLLKKIVLKIFGV